MSASDIIDQLGGTTAVARLCEVNPSAVSQWRESGIPNARMMFLRLARPDVFACHRVETIDERAGAGSSSEVA